MRDRGLKRINWSAVATLANETRNSWAQLSWQHWQTKQKHLSLKRDSDRDRDSETGTDITLHTACGLECADYNGTFSQHLHVERFAHGVCITKGNGGEDGAGEGEGGEE